MTPKKTILITGCSSGFGLHTATILSKTHHVIATMRNLQKQTLLLEAVKKAGGTVTLYECDVTKQDTITTLTKKIKETVGHIDILINNAGVCISGFFEDLTNEDIRNVMDPNFFGVLNMTRACMSLLKQSKNNPKIINISSVSGQSAKPLISAYNASKWALEGFSESLYYECAPFGIKVVLVEPGVFKTEIFDHNLRLATHHNNPKSPYVSLYQPILKLFEKRIRSRMGHPQKVCDLIAKIINKKSPKLRYVIGTDAKLTLFLRRWIPFEGYYKLVNYFFCKIVKKHQV